ncbi:efflux RND transporter permease subunit [Aquincola sp. J276]|uniref:efflux RND transporter permease subunit n=1 Tax=Aquincola sp. J276 TaxID=2898432 RepID=UPI0021518251|nr:efflux RND transporter permease subunit [Aquincola sp. J276]MCR5867037.1 efflux RND transporter permease subunit [Aquincola sp. J276]
MGDAAVGVSSGTAMNIVEDLVKELPPGIALDWTGASFQERLSSTQAPLLAAVSILFVIPVPGGAVRELVGAFLGDPGGAARACWGRCCSPPPAG